MLENIRISFQGIWSHKLRSLLTMLGIIIGIAAIITIVSTIKGTNEQIKKNLIGSGTNTVTVRLTESGDYDYQFEYSGIPSGVPVLGEEDWDKLAQIDNVKNVSFYNSREQVDYIYYNSECLQGGQLIGADINYLNTCGYIMTSGRNFMESDYTNFRKVAVIDQIVQDSLFPDESPVGKTLDIQGEPFIIIGVVKESSEFEPVINSVDDYYMYVYNDNANSGMVIIPDVDWGMMMQYDEPQNVKLLADSTDAMSNVGKAAEDILNDGLSTSGSGAGSSTGETEIIKYRAKDNSQTAEDTQKLSEATNQQLIWIASISLLVGGIGVMNIMLVSVTERTREIGLKKAIGARKNRIMSQFLTEAAVLTSLGGIVGTILGIALAEVIYKISGVPVSISVPSIVIAIVFSTIIGLVFGFLPARRAANLDPIVALRHE